MTGIILIIMGIGIQVSSSSLAGGVITLYGLYLMSTELNR